MARTNASLVIGVLRGGSRGSDYDGTTSLIPYLDSASLIVDRLNIAARDAGTPLLDTELEMVERWLTAHLYTKADPVYSSKSNSGVSGSFVRNAKTPEPYRDGAIAVDPSGLLNGILNGITACEVTWIGKPPSERIPYDQRD